MICFIQQQNARKQKIKIITTKIKAFAFSALCLQSEVLMYYLYAYKYIIFAVII